MADHHEVLFPHVAQPLSVGGCELPNRIVRTAHVTGYARGGVVTPQLVDYHRARARGGVGLTVLEIASVHETSPGPIDATTDEVIDGMGALVEAAHAQDMKVFQQLWHGGAEVSPRNGPAWAPSAVPSVSTGAVPLAMTPGMIDDVVAGFAAAARRCVAAGIDGIEVHAAHGYLLGQFLSPATNHRTDAHGGPLEHRMRLLERVLKAIRDAVPPGTAVGVRLSADDGMANGLPAPEVATAAKTLEAAGLIDFLDVSLGSYHAYSKIVGAMHEPRGYELTAARQVTAAVDVPTIVAGRIMELAEADRVIRDGVADMVSMVRATIADPSIVRRSLAGASDGVRPCISCNQACIGGVRGPRRRLGCTVNPDVGGSRDGQAVVPAAASRSVAVIGGGPAGLEAAVTAAARGHRVVLYEASDQLGGLVAVARRAPFRSELGAIVDWLAARAGELGVDIRLQHHVGGLDDLDPNPDVVLVATGAAAPMEGVQRHRPGLAVRRTAGARIHPPEDVLAGEVALGGHVVVFDDLGSHAAACTTEFLLEQGAAVTLATSRDMIAPSMEVSLQREPLLRRLATHDRFTAVVRVGLVEVTGDTVTLEGIDDGARHDVAADLVVLEAGRRGRREVLAGLAGTEHSLMGDVLVPRDLQHAIQTGRAAAMAI